LSQLPLPKPTLPTITTKTTTTKTTTIQKERMESDLYYFIECITHNLPNITYSKPFILADSFSSKVG
jgi:hypothetical protein